MPNKSILTQLLQGLGKEFNSPKPNDMDAFRRFIFRSAHPLDQQAALDGTSDYDYFGLFNKLGKNAGQYNSNTHFPDTYKKPTHPTFSNESQYAAFGNPGFWVANEFIKGR